MANLYLDSYSDTWREAGHLEQPNSPSAEDEFLASTEPDTWPDWQDLMLALDTLTERQRFVVQLRFGLKDGYTYTQREVAALMGITHQAVNDLEQASMKALSFLLQGTLPGTT